MRKGIPFIITLTLVLSLAFTAYAAKDSLTISDGSAQPGQIVYLTVTLNESVTGDTIGISYSFDSDDLKALPTVCQWEKKGTLDGFDSKNNGAWAAEDAVDLKGALCTLAFRIQEDADFTSTKVSCKVQIQNSGKTVGQYEAEAKISLSQEHTHSYGKWESTNGLIHSRTCTSCTDTQQEDHAWDDGKLVQNGGKQQKVYTCSVCGGTKSYDISAGQGQIDSTEETVDDTPSKETTSQQPSKETQPDNEPNEKPHPDMEVPAGTTEQDHTDHDHGKTTEETVRDYNQPTTEETGVRTPVDGTTEDAGALEHDHDHDHDHEGTESGAASFSWGLLAAVIAVAAVLIAVAAIFLEKRR